MTKKDSTTTKDKDLLCGKGTHYDPKTNSCVLDKK